MSTYFISPFEPPVWVGEIDLRISPEEYSRELKKLWPDIKIMDPFSESYVFEWSLKRDGEFKLTGGLQSGYVVVVIRGDINYIAEFAVWHRTVIPKKYNLYLFHETLSIMFELKSEMNKQEVLMLL